MLAAQKESKGLDFDSALRDLPLDGNLTLYPTFAVVGLSVIESMPQVLDSRRHSNSRGVPFDAG